MYRKKDNCSIFCTFYEYPHRRFHIRELARLTKTSPNTVTKYADEAVKEGMLRKESERNTVIYYANTTSNLYQERKRHHLIQDIIRSGLIDYLEEQFNQPITIIIFGSAAKGEYTRESDIDIFILSTTKREPNLTQYEKRLGKQIQLFSFTPKEYQKLSNKHLKNNIAAGIRIIGDLEVYT